MKSNRTDVFISYCHADKIYFEKMKRHFSIFRGKITIWDDTHILAGDVWKDKIMNALSKAKIAVLLISADFFSSRFIEDIEIPHLLEAADNDGAIILCLIVKPCLFNEYPEINKFQALNSPSKALSQLSESEQEQVFVDLALRIKKLCF